MIKVQRLSKPKPNHGDLENSASIQHEVPSIIFRTGSSAAEHRALANKYCESVSQRHQVEQLQLHWQKSSQFSLASTALNKYTHQALNSKIQHKFQNLKWFYRPFMLTEDIDKRTCPFLPQILKSDLTPVLGVDSL